MKHLFTIEGRLPGLNEIVGVARANRFASAAQKRELTKRVKAAAEAAGLTLIRYPIVATIFWYEKDRRRDPDNVQAAAKFIFDGLVEAGVLWDDSQLYVREIRHVVAPDPKHPRIVVILEELRDLIEVAA